METANLLSLYRQVQRQTLSNGLVALFYPSDETPTVNFQLWVKAGSIHEGNT